MHDLETCLVCGAKSQTLIYAATFQGDVTNAAEYFLAQRSKTAHSDIVSCDSCGFVYTKQQFELAEYNQIYTDASELHLEPEKFLKAESSRGRRLADLVSEYSVGGRLLDFGCGQGGFLHELTGFEKIGFEVAAMSSHATLDAEIITGDFLTQLGKAPLVHESFDVITAFDVFEHLPSLDQYLHALTKLTRSGGKLVISLPNINSWSAKLWGRHWGLILLEHLWYFSPDTLKRFVEAYGWKCQMIGHVPYDVTLSHLFQRVSQLVGFNDLKITPVLSNYVVPVPVGLMFSVFQKN